MFRHLLPLAKEWSISDDEELEAFIAAATEAQKREVASAFAPHFAALWKWTPMVHRESAGKEAVNQEYPICHAEW